MAYCLEKSGSLPESLARNMISVRLKMFEEYSEVIIGMSRA